MKREKEHFKRKTVLGISIFIFIFLFSNFSANTLGVSHSLSEVFSLETKIKQQVCETFESSDESCQESYDSVCGNLLNPTLSPPGKFGHTTEEVFGLSKMIYDAICSSEKKEFLTGICNVPYSGTISQNSFGHAASQITGLSEFINNTVKSLIETISCEEKCKLYYSGIEDYPNWNLGYHIGVCGLGAGNFEIPSSCYQEYGCNIIQEIYEKNNKQLYMKKYFGFKINEDTKNWNSWNLEDTSVTFSGINGDNKPQKIITETKSLTIHDGQYENKNNFDNYPTNMVTYDKSSKYAQNIIICPRKNNENKLPSIEY